MIMLKVTKNQGFNLSLEETFYKKSQGGDQIDPPAVLWLGKLNLQCQIHHLKFEEPDGNISKNQVT